MASGSSAIEHVETTTSVDTVAASAKGGDYHDLPPGYFRSAKFIGSFVGVIFLAMSLYVAFVLPANALSIINADLGPATNYTLITTVFTVVSGCCLTLVGRLGDILGRRYFLIGGQTFGLIGAIVGATAKDINTLIAASVLLGVAGAVQLTFTFVVCELVPNKHRASVDAILFASTIPFASMGAAVARLLATNTEKGWRWFYYLAIITCGISIVCFALFYFPPDYHQLHVHKPRRQQVKELDYVGIVLFCLGVILFMLGLSWGGSSYPWKSGHVIGTIVGGAVSLIIFGLYEAFVPLKSPLIPSKLLNRNYIAICWTSSVGTMIYFSMNVLWPIQIGALYSSDAVKVGWLSCCAGASVVVGQILAGLLFKPIGHAKWQLLACCIGMTAFIGALAATNQHTLGMALAFIVLGGLSVGFLELITIIMAGLICEEGDIGLASGFLGSLRQIFGTISTTIYVTILDNRLAVELPKDVVPAAVGAGLPETSITALFDAITAGTAAAMAAVPGITATIEVAVGNAVKDAYAASFKTVYLVSIAFGGLAIIAALFSRNIDDRMTDEVSRKIRNATHSPVDEKVDEKV